MFHHQKIVLQTKLGLKTQCFSKNLTILNVLIAYLCLISFIILIHPVRVRLKVVNEMYCLLLKNIKNKIDVAEERSLQLIW